MMDLIETTPKMDLAIQILRTWWRSCAPNTPSTARCFNGVNNGKRRTPLFRGCGDFAAQVDRADGAGGGRCRPQGRTGHAVLFMKGNGMMNGCCASTGKKWKQTSGAADGVLMVDGSDVPKQGVHAVGVKRQYWGKWGSGPTARPVCLSAMAVPRATPYWNGGYVPANGSPTRRMRHGAGSVVFPPDHVQSSLSWPRR